MLYSDELRAHPFGQFHENKLLKTLVGVPSFQQNNLLNVLKAAAIHCPLTILTKDPDGVFG